MRDNRNETYKNMMKVAKRIALEILISLPICIIFAYLTRNVITHDALQIVCFMVIMAVAVLIGELVYKRKQQKKQAQEILNPKKDVFK